MINDPTESLGEKMALIVTGKYTPKDVDLALDNILQPEDNALLRIRNTCRKEQMPEIEVSAQQGKLLELLVRTAKAKNVLEMGTLGGYSTVCLARGVGEDGFVTSLEYERQHAVVAHRNLYLANVHSQVSVLHGDAHEMLPQMAPNAYDFVFIDADKESNKAYFQWADQLGTEDVTIVVDNVIRDGRVLDPDRKDKLEFIEFLGQHQGFDSTVVQTVGAKGWDGFVLAKRKEQH